MKDFTLLWRDPIIEDVQSGNQLNLWNILFMDKKAGSPQSHGTASTCIEIFCAPINWYVLS